MALPKMMLLASVAIAGLTGCAARVSDVALCARTVPLANETRAALLDHAPEVPAAVGEASTSLLIAIYAGCSASHSAQ